MKYLNVPLYILVSAMLVLPSAASSSASSASSASAVSSSKQKAMLSFSSAQYFRASEPYYREGADSQMNSLLLGVELEGHRGPWVAKADARDEFQASEDYHYLKPKEAFVGWAGEKSQLYLGRKQHVWSEADQFWRQGLWEPRFTDDKLTLEPAGLSGAFFQLGSEASRLTVFATGLFVPETGPNFSVADNQFVSRNPWFRPPGSVVNISGIPTDVHYQVAEVDVESVVNHGGGAAQWVWSPSETTFLRVGAAYKPINSLYFGFPLELHLTDPKYAAVKVTPRVLYHQILTIEGGVHQSGAWHSWFSLTEERPIRDQTPEEWTTQETTNAHIGSVYLGYDWRGEGAFASRAYLSYVHVDGGDAPDRGSITGEESFFERRYQLMDAVRLGAHHTMRWAKAGLSEVDSSLTYDFAQHGVVYRLALKQPVARFWDVHVSADLIGLADTSGRVSDGFMSLYRANDRYGLGVSYVF